MNLEVKDAVEQANKIVNTHIEATELELKAFPESQYWKGQLDAQKNIRDALVQLAKQRGFVL